MCARAVTAAGCTRTYSRPPSPLGPARSRLFLFPERPEGASKLCPRGSPCLWLAGWLADWASSKTLLLAPHHDPQSPIPRGGDRRPWELAVGTAIPRAAVTGLVHGWTRLLLPQRFDSRVRFEVTQNRPKPCPRPCSELCAFHTSSSNFQSPGVPFTMGIIAPASRRFLRIARDPAQHLTQCLELGKGSRTGSRETDVGAGGGGRRRCICDLPGAAWSVGSIGVARQ